MEETWISSEQVVLNDGINSAFRPDQIGASQASWAANITIRDGKAQTRSYKLIQRAILPHGVVQGAGYFSRDTGLFVVSIWGQLWRIVPSGNNVVVDQIPLETRNSAVNLQAWFCETNGSLVIQDNQSAPIIYDGSTARRSNIFANEVPIGSSMAYGNGRLAVTVNDRSVQVGNITSNIFQSELLFTETTYLAGGGAFFFTHPVSGLAFLPVNNTNTGFGSLVVLGNRYTDSLRLEVTARELWDQIPGFQQVLLPDVGCAGQYSIVRVNQDLYWRDGQGQIWSLRSAQWDALSPGNSPISREVARITDYETESQLPLSSGIFFDNRLFFLASPFYNRFGSASYGNIISLDAAPLATMRGKSPPAYDGVAEGLEFSHLMVGQINDVNRAFVISTDADGENRLWEIVPQALADASMLSLDNGSTNSLVPYPVTSYYESRRFDLGAPTILKRLTRIDMWPTDIQGDVQVSVYYRTDNRTQWNFWDTVSFCAKMTNNDGEWKDLSQQERGRIKSLTMPYSTDNLDNQAQMVGYGFQVRIVWTGYMLMDRIKIWGLQLPDTAFSNIQDQDASCLQNVVTNNTVSYSIPVGGLGYAYTDQDGNVYTDEFGVPYTQQPPS